jgi:hypothetical protein
MRIGIEINGVLRDTLGKFTQIYTKYLVDKNNDETLKKTYNVDLSGNTEEIVSTETFNYEIISDVTSLNLTNHFKFKDEDELYDFMYKEHAMEIFGHAGSVNYTTMNDFNDFYLEMRDLYDISIVSNEIGKSKPASLFFLSKFGCLTESIKFYSESTINSMWDSIDVLLTANPSLLLNNPDDKVVIKCNTNYNCDIKTQYEISEIKELKLKLKEIYG